MITLRRSARTAQAGFTLIEIMIAVAIVGLMLAVVGPALYRQFAGASESAAKNQMASLKQAVGTYYIDTLRYPDKLSDLVRKPADPTLAAKWKGPYLETDEVPYDPWDNAYQYKKTPGGKHPYEIYSYGPEGRDTPREKWIYLWKQ